MARFFDRFGHVHQHISRVCFSRCVRLSFCLQRLPSAGLAAMLEVICTLLLVVRVFPKVFRPLISLSSEPCIQVSSQGAWRKCLPTSATYLSAGTAGLAETASSRSTWLYWRAPRSSNYHHPNIQVSSAGTNPATDELGPHKKVGGRAVGRRKHDFVSRAYLWWGSL